jgi:hypothetical protein
VRTGWGRLTKANGDWYDGQWRGELAEGQGEAEIAGQRYSGVWARGCLSTPLQQAAWDVPADRCP